MSEPDNEAVLLHEIERLETLKKSLSTQFHNTVDKIQEIWDTICTVKYGVSKGNIVECDGVRYIVDSFDFPRFRPAGTKPEFRWLDATLESDTRPESEKEVYKLPNWQKVEKTA